MKPSTLFKKPKDPKMKISIKVSDKTKYLCSNGDIVCGIVTRVLPWTNGGATYFISHENGMVGEIRCDNPYLFGEDEVIPQDEIDYSKEAGESSSEMDASKE
jgi:hypothetical protein